MAKESEDTDALVKPSKEEEKMPSEEIEVPWNDSEYGSDDVSLGSHNSTSNNVAESEHSQLMVDSVPHVPLSVISSASNSVITDLESNPSVSQNPDYCYDDDVPFSLYAPLKTKERTAPLIDHQKSKKQKKQEKKERKKEIKKERQEVQQNRMMQKPENGSEKKPENDLESKVVADEHEVPQYRLSTTMAGLTVAAAAEPYVAPYSSHNFLYDDGEIDLVGEIDDDEDEFSIEGLESIKIAKTKRRSSINQPPIIIPPKEKSNDEKNNDKKSNDKKKRSKKRGRRADYEEPEAGDEHETAERETTANPPAHTTKDVAARVEAIFTNKEKILEEFDEYCEKIGEEQKQLEQMLEGKRGRSNAVKGNRGRSLSKPKQSGRGQSKSAKARSVSKAAMKRRKEEAAVPKQSLDDTLKVVLGEKSKPPDNRRTSLAGRSRSAFLVGATRNGSKGMADKKSLASNTKVKPARRGVKGKPEDLTLDDSIQRPQAASKRAPRRSSSVSELEGSRRVHNKDSTNNTNTKTKAKKGKKGKLDTLTLDDDSVERPSSTSQIMRRRSSSDSDLERLQTAKIDSPTHQTTTKGEKTKLSSKTLQSLSADLDGKSRNKAKNAPKGKKGKADTLTLDDDSVEKPLSTSQIMQRQSRSDPDLDRLTSPRIDSSSTHQTKGNKTKLSSKTLQSLSADLDGKSSGKAKNAPKGKKGKADTLTLDDDSVERPLSTSQITRRKSNSYSDLEGRKSADNVLNHDSKNERMKLPSHSEDAAKSSSKRKARRGGKKEQQEALSLNDSVERPRSVSKGMRRRSSSYSELEGKKHNNSSTPSRNSDFGARKTKASSTHAKEHRQKNTKTLSVSEHGRPQNTMKRKSSKRSIFDDDQSLEPTLEEFQVPLKPPSLPNLRQSWSSSRQFGSSSSFEDAMPTDLKRRNSLGLENQLKRLNKKHGPGKTDSPSIKSRKKNKSPSPQQHGRKRTRSPKKSVKRSKSPAAKLKKSSNEGQAGNSKEGRDDVKEKKKTKAGKRNSENEKKESDDTDGNKKKEGRGREQHRNTTEESALGSLGDPDDDSDIDSDLESVEEFATPTEEPIVGSKSSKPKKSERSSDAGSVTKATKKKTQDNERQSGSSKEDRDDVKEKKKLSRTSSKSFDKTSKRNSEHGKKESHNTEDNKEKDGSGSEQHRRPTEESSLGDPDYDSDLESVEEFATPTEEPVVESKSSKPKKSENATTLKRSSEGATATKPIKKKAHKKSRSGGSLDFSSTLEELAGTVVTEVDGLEAPKLKKSTGIPNPDLPKHKASTPSHKPKKSADPRKNGLSATMH
mmetsp:Transcript_42734/g.103358  ORF Transcript_42734/g.103358 Transcript_42734/m.103358 type:complete len:1307 (-) Transcript_42734:81-4001(-)